MAFVRLIWSQLFVLLLAGRISASEEIQVRDLLRLVVLERATVVRGMQLLWLLVVDRH